MTAQSSAFEIPTVDVAPYLADAESEEARGVVRQVRSACMTSGFFQIVGHGVSAKLQQSVFQAAKLLFDLPTDEKVKLASGRGRGYELIGSQTLQPGTKPDLKEGFYVGPEADDKGPPFRDFRYPNLWPADELIHSDQFKLPLQEYRDRLNHLSLQLMRILAEGLSPGADRYLFDGFCRDPLAVVRLLHYPPHPKTESDPQGEQQLGAGAHTDFGAITLLMQDQNSGLQVWDQDTHTWIDVPPSQDAYVVNVGDMLDMWTQGLYKSNTHRVINTSGTDRYSVPFFFDGNLDYVLKPLNGTNFDTSSPDRTVEDFMKERYMRTYGSK